MLLFYSRYGEKLITAAEGAVEPVKSALGRGALFMGGLKAKTVCRATATSMAMFVKNLAFKIDYLRIAGELNTVIYVCLF